MREILFRGKCLDNGEWVCSANIIHLNEDDEYYIPAANSGCTYHLDEDGNLVKWEEVMFRRVVPATIGQYTGLTDKNGRKIFEDDIVRLVSLLNDHHQKGATRVLQVRFFMGNMCLCLPGLETGTPIYPLCVGSEIEVIGNIHDNPELLEA